MGNNFLPDILKGLEPAFFAFADALDMGVRASSLNYPADMGTYTDLVEMWMGMTDDPAWKLSHHCKRLIMFAPEGTKYEELNNVLEGSVFRPVAPGRGLADLEFEDILETLFPSYLGRR